MKYINKKDFFRIYSVDEINLVNMGLFEKSDIEEVEKTPRLLSLNIIKKFISYLMFSVKHPRFMNSFIVPKALSLIKGSSDDQNISLAKSVLVSDYNLLASIAASFKPKIIFEIGTHLGWGTASFKKVCPTSVVYTMNPRLDIDSNNPIHEMKVGEFYRKKKLNIRQIWSDSTKYDYSKIPKVDVTYIDGNHQYDYVYKDLENTSKITKKCIILDDYIPEIEAQKNNIVYGPWNDGVVGATSDFLKSKSTRIAKAYWLKGSKLAVLIMR